MKDSYKTVENEASTKLVERRSEFIATVRPTETEEEAIALIVAMRTKYHDATHNVYAYVIGENNIERFSDDGEPGGTAGMPVLDVIKKEGLINVAVVITRYFGGIMLGAGGLVRAYSKSAKEGVDSAKIITKALCIGYRIKAPYYMLGKLQYTFLNRGYIIADTIYEEDITLMVYVKCQDETKFIGDVTEISLGTVFPDKIDTTYLTL